MALDRASSNLACVKERLAQAPGPAAHSVRSRHPPPTCRRLGAFTGVPPFNFHWLWGMACAVSELGSLVPGLDMPLLLLQGLFESREASRPLLSANAGAAPQASHGRAEVSHGSRLVRMGES